jgi:type IV pilus assembly protein PilQ
MLKLLNKPAAAAVRPGRASPLMMNKTAICLNTVRSACLGLALLLLVSGLRGAEPLAFRESARRISVDFHDADIRSVLMAFSEFSGVSIIASQNVSGKVTARINDTPWDRALITLLENNGLSVREQDGILTVDTIENIRASEKLEDLNTRIFRLNFLKSQELGPTVTALLSERGKLQAEGGSNSLMVIDIQDRIAKIAEVIAELDRETRQVEITVQLSFINYRELRELGIDWSTHNLSNPLTDTRFNAQVSSGSQVTAPNASFSVGTVRKGVNIAAVINSLESMNKARTIAKPVITTLNNLTAKVLVGERTPLRVVDYGAVGVGAQAPQAMTQMVETGVKLEVLPQITENDKILIQILAENSTAESGPEGVFFKTQEASTRLLLDDGATGVIAGLTVKSDSKVKSGVPGIRKVPVLGRLFSYDKDLTEEEELVIIITAQIIAPTEAESPSPTDESQTPGGK